MKTQQSYNTPDAGAETPVWRWKSTGEEEQVISTWHRERQLSETVRLSRGHYNEVFPERNVQLTLACGCQLPIFHHNTQGLKAMETRKKNTLWKNLSDQCWINKIISRNEEFHWDSWKMWAIKQVEYYCLSFRKTPVNFRTFNYL